jgi:hypothetical protein
MDAGINNIFYMELHLGPKMANGTCGKTIITGIVDRDSTVFLGYLLVLFTQNISVLYTAVENSSELLGWLWITVLPYHKIGKTFSDNPSL